MNFVSLKGKFYVIFGILLLVLSSVGAISVYFEEEGYVIDRTYSYTSYVDYSLVLEGNHSYEIFFGAHDESSTSDAVVRVYYTLYIDNIVMLNSELYARDSLDRSEDDDEADTSDSIYYFIAPTEDVELEISGDVHSGDYCYVAIYRDVPASIDMKYLFCGVVFLLGVVNLLVGGHYETESRNEQKRLVTEQRRERTSSQISDDCEVIIE